MCTVTAALTAHLLKENREQYFKYNKLSKLDFSLAFNFFNPSSFEKNFNLAQILFDADYIATVLNTVKIRYEISDKPSLHRLFIFFST
jgi:hypothetical protein